MTSPSSSEPGVDPFVSRVGGILSADIAVPEHERVRNFYARILTTGEAPLWRDDLLNRGGVPIIGLGARDDSHAELPLQWMPHIQVGDVAASVSRALELGGKELVHGRDAEGVSQWAVIADPNGAAFGVIPQVPGEALAAANSASKSPGSTASGCIAWVDLTVPEAGATRDFYQQVIGWTTGDVAMSDGGEDYADYMMLGSDGRPAAGICHARGENSGLPPVWMLYLPVGDLTESLRRASEGGGRVLTEVRRADGEHAYAVLRDPVGVCLALVPA